MTHVEDLIARARQNGLSLSVAQGKVKVVAPKERDAEINDLIAEIRQYKIELITLLSKPEAPLCYVCDKPCDPVTDVCNRKLWACWGCAKSA